MSFEALLKLCSIVPPFMVAMATLIIVKRWGMGHHATISEHAAQNKVAFSILAFAVLGGGAMYYTLMWFWILPKFHPYFFAELLVIAFVCQVFFSLAPADKNRKYLARVHTFAASVVGIVMYLLAWTLVLGGQVVEYWSLLAIWCFIGFTTLSLLSLIAIKRLRRNMLFFEVTYVTLFCIFIGLITYL